MLTRPPHAWMTCTRCGDTSELEERYACPRCGGQLSITIDVKRARDAFAQSWRSAGSMWQRFGSVLPVRDPHSIVSLGEGSTPLVRSRRLAGQLGLRNLHFKLESSNPTGSFKDRQVSVAISAGHAWARSRYATVSSGNVGVALSAYCAKAGLEAHVWVSDDTASSKRNQISIYGAQVYLVPAPREGTMSDYFALYTSLQDYCLARGLVPMVSARPVNPYMVEGSKTIAFELVAELGHMPDDVFCCVGGGGLLGGLEKGFRELTDLGQADRVPRIHGGQRSDHLHAPIDRLDQEPYRSGDYYRSLDGEWAWTCIQATAGRLYQVDAAAVTRAQALLATTEGIFAEPQGAYATAALVAAVEQGAIDPASSIVCVVTGSGLKDMAAAERFASHGGSQREPVRVRGLADVQIA